MASTSAQRHRGTCKWFNAVKGFGFVTPEGGGDDLFVHQLNIKTDGFRSLRDGEPVEFDLEEGEDGKNKAINVTGPDGAPPLGAPAPRQDQFAGMQMGMPMMQMMGGRGRGNRGGPPMGGGRYGPGGGPIPHRGPDAMGPQAASTSGGYYSYGNPPGIPPDARPFYIGYYIPGGGQADMSGQGQGRGRGDNRRMSGPPVFFSQGPPPQGMMGPPPQNMQHSPPTHIMHQQQNQPQGQYQQYPPQQYPPGMMGGGHVMSQGPQPAASSGLQLVVHNLPWSCTWQQLKEHFDDYKAERAEVVLDSFGRSRGFGIVRFLTPQDAEAACEALNNSSIEGRVISVRPDRYA